MRIALIGTRGVPARYGGFETAVEEVGQRLVLAGHEVTVYCRNPGQSMPQFLGMRLVNLPALRLRAAETLSHTALSTSHAILRERPDVAFVFNAANAPFIRPLQVAGIPVAIHVDGLEWQRAKWGPRAAAYYRWAEGRCAAWADCVIADAAGIVEHMRIHHGVEAVFIPYGAPIISPGVDRLNELGLRSREYHLLVARFVPENHVLEIVEGYVASGSIQPLVVVGDAPYAAEYRSRVKAAAGDDPRVRFLGSLWDQELLDCLYGNASTYLHGHSVGGTNPSLLRALGAGAPVVAWDVAFNREVAMAAGRYASGPKGFGQACEDAERHPTAAQARGRAGRLDVAERYRWEDVAAGYAQLAAAMLRRRGSVLG